MRRNCNYGVLLHARGRRINNSPMARRPTMVMFTWCTRRIAFPMITRTILVTSHSKFPSFGRHLQPLFIRIGRKGIVFLRGPIRVNNNDFNLTFQNNQFLRTCRFPSAFRSLIQCIVFLFRCSILLSIHGSNQLGIPFSNSSRFPPTYQTLSFLRGLIRIVT